ncbi:MAG: dihydroorotase [Actinobacteria bacterium]|nr:dihydroorotase [Actinomycetota bacterium]
MLTDKMEAMRNTIGKDNILIKSGTVFEPSFEKGIVSDILIQDGIIRIIDKNINIEDMPKDSVVLNSQNYFVFPGFVDMHVHLREPGNEEEEDIDSGSMAAFRGGITSVACMPNTNPPIDREYLVNYILNKARLIDFKIYPVAAMTKNLEGREMTEIGLLKEAGAIAFSDDGKCVQDSKLMYEIMKYASHFDLPLILHEEDYYFSDYGLAHEGYYSAKLGLDGISRFAEELMVSRDIMLAKKAGAKIHITHVSSKGSIILIKRAKEEGLNITCDVTPHHLYFNDSFLESYDTNLKVNPSLKSEEDREALASAISEGIIDAIASDHAPHYEAEKNTTFKDAATGTIGLETLFKASYTKLVREERLKLGKLVALLTSGPAKILNIKTPAIKVGEKADIAIIDLEKNKKIEKEDFCSKSKNSAFIGQNLYGEVVYTINNGRLVFISENC